MKIVCLSDTHELHRDVDVPGGDLLIHAGDVTFFSRRSSLLSDFNEWLGSLPHRHKVVIPGNHDDLLEIAENCKHLTNAHLLINTGIEIEGLKIWGSPVTPYGNTAFGIPTSAGRTTHWATMPKNLDILITHGPPYGVLDHATGEPHHCGDPELRAAVIEKRPRLHIFGHVHNSYGQKPTKHTLFLNAALFGELGDLDKKPVVLLIKPREARL